ncbi:hypothetical protein GGTG_00536 [Gaeumannomyces tritici R3-111a-1]|uniref:Uncharacterized protein n=1 Tax=Gaeumannomyces tritici (strain R3-111a-1) TaxID=644352 RepID=J3NH00_GAET3|nr:hypothetical protein GGTG_00536 [Gaeumannomyces tritici R3-111a-1]EJT80540.1 hypothetical protein GGTG_00536 [Gaeumannomyces tritici R3-111a-1]
MAYCSAPTASRLSLKGIPLSLEDLQLGPESGNNQGGQQRHINWSFVNDNGITINAIRFNDGLRGDKAGRPVLGKGYSKVGVESRKGKEAVPDLFLPNLEPSKPLGALSSDGTTVKEMHLCWPGRRSKDRVGLSVGRGRCVDGGVDPKMAVDGTFEGCALRASGVSSTSLLP